VLTGVSVCDNRQSMEGKAGEEGKGYGRKEPDSHSQGCHES
jgi:hypothetical protein